MCIRIVINRNVYSISDVLHTMWRYPDGRTIAESPSGFRKPVTDAAGWSWQGKKYFSSAAATTNPGVPRPAETLSVVSHYRRKWHSSSSERVWVCGHVPVFLCACINTPCWWTVKFSTIKGQINGLQCILAVYGVLFSQNIRTISLGKWSKTPVGESLS